MKKIITTLAVAGLYCAFGCVKASAWFSDTHQHITETAFAILKKENKLKIYNFYSKYIPEIIEGSVEPDKDGDVDKSGTGTHFYSCVNSKGKELSDTKGYYKNLNGKLSKSARTMLEDNYTSALCLYKSNKINEAMHTLGRAIHFLSDIGCTVHASGIKYQDKPTNVHNAYERHINTLCKQYSVNKIDKRLQKTYDNFSFANGVNKLSKNASRFVQIVSALDPKAFNDAGKGTIPTTLQNVVALLIKFFNDCKDASGNFLVDEKMYTFKNELTGEVITVAKKGLSLEPINSELEQKFTIVISAQGTFGIKASDEGYINENCKNFDYLEKGAKSIQFRFFGLGNKRFRITTGGTDFEKVLACSKIGTIAIADFEPENSSQIWIIS